MTIVVDGAKTQVEQVIKQLYKLIDVLRVSDVTEDRTVDRELALIKVHATNSTSRAEITQLADIFRGKIVDVANDSVIVEVTGDEEKVDSLLQMLPPLRDQGDGPHRHRLHDPAATARLDGGSGAGRGAPGSRPAP